MPNNNSEKPGLLRPRTSAVRSVSKQLHPVQPRKVLYRVGYNWNKGGRLKELRIRHLARKFLKIWIHNTFGRVLPHTAKSHYRRVILKQAFEAWKDEWWTSQREWSLTLRAECHYRYSLYNQTFHMWKRFLVLQSQKKNKIHDAKTFADRQHLRHKWDRWEKYTKMSRIKRQKLNSALLCYKHSLLTSSWSTWQNRLQHIKELHRLEDQAHKRHGLTVQHKVLLHWRDMHTASCNDRIKHSRALQHNINRLKRKSFHQWIIYVSYRRTKHTNKVVAQNTSYLRVMRMCWNTWCQALYQKWSEEVRLEAVGHLALRICQHKVMNRWKAYVKLCKEKVENSQEAQEHHRQHLLRSAVYGLSQNVHRNKTKRLNNNVAVQHYKQSVIGKYWRLWQQCLEEAEDRNYQHLSEKAHIIYSISLSRSCFYHWKERLAALRHMRVLAGQADVFFAEHILPRCFQSWFNYTRQKRLLNQRKVQAEIYNRQRQYSWVFYTWWGLFEKNKKQKHTQMMAIFHEERGKMETAWIFWRKRTEMRIKEREKQDISEQLYQHRLLQRTMAQWKDNSAEIKDRRNREQQAYIQGDFCIMRWALEKWRKFVQLQRAKKKKAEKMQHYHEVQVLKHSFAAWKKHNLQMHSIHAQAEDLHKQQTQKSLRRALATWQENAADFLEFRVKMQKAQNHCRHILQFKAFNAWREATMHAVTKRRQQMELLSCTQQSMKKGRLLHFFQLWRAQTRNVQTERLHWQKAKWHHETTILSKALQAWEKHHSQYQKYKVMKRQANLLLRLKIWQTFFDQWKMKLQHRLREARQTEQALWHWSLTLQAKVLYAWRLQVSEQRREREEVAQAAQFYRDHLLREGVTCILTYAAQMSDLTTSLTKHTQEQHSRCLQRVVRRCALKWKHKALCKKAENPDLKEQPAKKNVSFFLPELKRDSCDEGDQEHTMMLINYMPPQLRCSEQLLKSPSKCVLLESHASGTQPLDPSCSAAVTVTSTLQGHDSEAGAPPGLNVSMEDSSQNQELLLPPSAFMTTSSLSPEGPQLEQYCTPIPSVNPTVIDPVSVLTNELLKIKQDMKSYQQDKKQLRTWCKLKDVLHAWLQTSGQDNQTEKNAVSEELAELENRIVRLTSKLSKQKPTMLQHVEKIQRLRASLSLTNLQ